MKMQEVSTYGKLDSCHSAAPRESVLILAPEKPPMPPAALLFTAEPPRDDDADSIAVLLRVV